MRKWKTGAGALLASLAIGLAGVALVACGDDSDEQSGVDEAKASETQEAPDAGTAERLETYLKNNAKQLPAGHAKGGMVISFVEVSNGELKVWTFLNSDLARKRRKPPRSAGWRRNQGCPRRRARSWSTAAVSSYSAAKCGPVARPGSAEELTLSLSRPAPSGGNVDAILHDGFREGDVWLSDISLLDDADPPLGDDFAQLVGDVPESAG